MASELSKTQIDRLGERLKKGDISEADLRLLDLYRRSFTDAYEFVVGTIRKELKLEPTGRPSKTTTSITDKLRRESIRLTQIQDIAGCRLTAADTAAQNAVVESLVTMFEQTIIVDRRERPSNGYRAVHVIARHRSKMVEVQVRTSLQHLWAEISEKFSDVVDSHIKYGMGDEGIQSLLMKASSIVASQERLDTNLATALQLSSRGELTDQQRQQVDEMRESIRVMRQDTYTALGSLLEYAKERGGDNAVSN